ncbi:MAG: CRTAC1 family protein [Thermoanaerobaculia bacterium]|nr:CRTAC1 family protein [Thermoanaerobaculia bacterium]
MIAALAEVRDRTQDVNPWQGDLKARLLRAQLDRLSTDGDDVRHFELLLGLAQEELRLGHERVAIDHYDAALALLPILRDRIPHERALDAVFRAGVANLRSGETQNCSRRHGAESCILPIRGAGIHRDDAGSRRAIEHFLRVLEATPRSAPLHIKTVWLLNLAFMTVGGHPHEVPAAYRLAPDTFGGTGPFPHFENVAPALGVAAFNLSGGAVLDDFDGDDDLDLLTTTFDAYGEPHYYRNRGDGTFEDRTETANLEGLYGGLNLVHADYDNDGDLDVFVTRGAWLASAGLQPNSLWQNDGSGRFLDVTFAAGLAEPSLPTQTAAWADYDNDGDLDLFVGNEHGQPPPGFGLVTEPFESPSQLFRNNGDGTFTDVAAAAGVRVVEFVKGAVWGDYDGDRHPDLYLSVLGGPNRLFHNGGDGTFEDRAEALGVTGPESSFPVWFFDYDNDGALDLFVSSYPGGTAEVAGSYLGIRVPRELPRLYRGSGGGPFEEVGREAGLTRIHLPMGSNFGDLDNDGYLDFYLGTGYPDYEGLMPNVLYHNVDGRRFEDVTLAAGVGHLQKGHAVAFADYDGDGQTDIFAQMGGAYSGDRANDALFRNPGFDNGWIGLHLVGETSNRSAIGARIRADILAPEGPRSIYRHVNSGGSFGCNPLRQTIGLGKTDRIERLEVWWPTTDLRQEFEDVVPNRSYRLREGGVLERVPST